MDRGMEEQRDGWMEGWIRGWRNREMDGLKMDKRIENGWIER